jgi:hypothetical protein
LVIQILILSLYLKEYLFKFLHFFFKFCRPFRSYYLFIIKFQSTSTLINIFIKVISFEVLIIIKQKRIKLLKEVNSLCDDYGLNLAFPVPILTLML